ncbi:shikimate dehydrogenase [Oerskovia sp. M15]
MAHSLSPVLHSAAYRALGLEGWEYSAIDVTEEQLRGFVDGLDDSWAGLSLTMPLKQVVFELLDHVEPLAEVVGAVNTVLFQPTGSGGPWSGPTRTSTVWSRRCARDWTAARASGRWRPPSCWGRGDGRLDPGRARRAGVHVSDRAGAFARAHRWPAAGRAPDGVTRASRCSTQPRRQWRTSTSWCRPCRPGRPTRSPSSSPLRRLQVLPPARRPAGRGLRPRPTALSRAWVQVGGTVVGGSGCFCTRRPSRCAS